jgi:asparagine synthase (glutamine-hydrolysing)
MSGICGLFRRTGEPVTSEPIEKMLGKLRHRGIDGQATWQSGNVGLGHCMLHVTLESLLERLPKYDGKSGYAITADARIDNRKELIATLAPDLEEDEPSDSELILSAYRKWGVECPTHLLGDFAFAIVDQARQTVFCASDPVGVKSLYYYLSDREFVFASEIKALLALPEVPCRLNELRIAEYLVTLFEDLTGTFYEGILRLPGACTLTVTRQSARIGQYWSLDPKRELRLK